MFVPFCYYRPAEERLSINFEGLRFLLCKLAICVNTINVNEHNFAGNYRITWSTT